MQYRVSMSLLQVQQISGSGAAKDRLSGIKFCGTTLIAWCLALGKLLFTRPYKELSLKLLSLILLGPDPEAVLTH